MMTREMKEYQQFTSLQRSYQISDGPAAKEMRHLLMRLVIHLCCAKILCNSHCLVGQKIYKTFVKARIDP